QSYGANGLRPEDDALPLPDLFLANCRLDLGLDPGVCDRTAPRSRPRWRSLHPDRRPLHRPSSLDQTIRVALHPRSDPDRLAHLLHLAHLRDPERPRPNEMVDPSLLDPAGERHRLLRLRVHSGPVWTAGRPGTVRRFRVDL